MCRSSRKPSSECSSVETKSVSKKPLTIFSRPLPTSYKPTQRIAELENAAGVISMDHHITAATAFFDNFPKFEKRPCAVVFGYKQQGKSQFLCCVPGSDHCAFGGDPNSFDPNSVLQDTRLGNPRDFMVFNKILSTFCDAMELRVWMIVDEATSDELQAFPITWPEEQNLTPFHFVLSGSLGMAQFVTKQHLRKAVWDLPLFDSGETAELAKDLQVALGIPNRMLEDALGFNMIQDEQVNLANLGEALDGLFGGVPGYTAEFFLALHLGLSLDMFLPNCMSALWTPLPKPWEITDRSTKWLKTG
ncbi:Aste57867_16147 [Aphanomyces stellatus]|uniref:Aste57867_16147 protein n=1 Tax=Aphanomyces stellatus TaxID=120398 RepID=A0A485L5Q9_9STRA|nr:hypothetical protein As57867_016091 [Aphanomyces stellatus]VFT92927.1 Aste57867_16147 [Aphanomyces stellatus]